MIEPEGGLFTFDFDAAGQVGVIEQPWGESIDFDHDSVTLELFRAESVLPARARTDTYTYMNRCH